MQPVSEVVLEASALLALLLQKPGGDSVAAQLPAASISAVNLAEVVGRLLDAGVPADECREALAGLALDVVPFDEAAAFATGALRPLTRRAGLSLGDRACLALAMRQDRTALTADRAWKRRKLGIPIELLPRRAVSS